MTKKQIIILSPAHPLRGGIASSSERLAQELQKEGHKVKILSFSLQYPNFLFPGKTQYTSDAAPEGVEIDTRINSVNPLNWLRSGLYLKKLKADLIIVRYWLPFMGPSLGSICRIAKQNKHTKVLALADNILPHEQRIGDRQFTQYFCNSVDGFLVMSRSVGEDAKQFSPNKPVKYSPHPIYDNYGQIVGRQTAIEQLKLNAAHKYLLFFGFIRDYKGLDLLLKAMAHPQVKALDIRLIVAGEYYSNQDKYNALIAEYGLEDRLVLHNEFISNDDVKYYFAAADLVAQPYKTATQSGISQLAYHFEKPMLVTRVGGLPEIVEHGKAGYVLDVDDAAISEAILDFYNNNRAAAMTEGVRENKKRFGWDKMVRAIEEVMHF